MSTDGGVDKGIDKGVRILSLDGGGPGTYSQLLIIKQYMVRLANDLGINEGDVYPADYFDLIGGVGFGGLVAILLGHLWMNVDEAIDALLNVALAVFPENPHPELDQETRTRRLRESVESILQTRGIPPERKMQDTNDKSVGCKVALYAATTADLSHPIVLRNYKPRTPSPNPTVVDAICATMATPSYFSSVKIGPHRRQQTFIGGPRGTNNPTRELLKEASSIFGKEKLVAQIVSLGCGRSRVYSVEKNTNTEGASRSVQEMAADCEAVAKELSMRLCDMDAYLRLNVDRGMENVLMNEWDDLGPIETHTSAYVEMAEISGTIEASLRRLQGETGTITLGEINHPRAADDVRDKLNKHKHSVEDLDRAVDVAVFTLDLARQSEESDLLKRLKPVEAAIYDEDHSCMEGTRTAVLNDIIAWASKSLDGNAQPNGSNPNVFWLYGMPGLGKTSVANSLCDRLRKSKSLGGSFFCKHDDIDLRDPKRILPTLITKLVRMWGPFRKQVAKVLLEEPQINPESTRGELLLKSLQFLKKHPPHPLALVIDALDECGQLSTRGPLLSCLTQASSLVNWLKIVVTSRPERDIKAFFDSRNVTIRDLATDDLNGEDIRLFTERRMNSVAIGRHLQSDWPGQERISQIVERARGLFIFVDTLSRLVDVLNPEPLLVEVLSGTSEGANAELHRLYSMAITSRAVIHTPEFHPILRAVIAVSAYRPLCADTLAQLIDLEVPTILSWVDELGSLLYQDEAEENVIRVRHLSVLEFLVGPTSPEEFRVDLRLANSDVACYCLGTMTKKLKFNICELKTSCVFNADIPDLNDQVEQRVPDALQYSCIYWSNHLCGGIDPVSAEITRLLDNFFAASQPLYWLEVLSLMGKVPVAILSLRVMKGCFKNFEPRHQHLVEDVLRFVLAFFTPISTSTPHLYISSLSFMPAESNLWKRVCGSFPESMNVCTGRMKSWPAPSGIWQGHTSGISSVTYSPDGKNVVSGSSDNTIRIWDAETGAAVGEPLVGHTESVQTVAYSPDGRKIISGSSDQTIRIWDAQTGAPVVEPLIRLTSVVWDVAYSPDGRNIVSGSHDGTIQIWDAQTGAPVGEPLGDRDCAIWRVAYSPDGRNIASGSHDGTIQIWDTQAGSLVNQFLAEASVELQIENTNGISSVVYSPDGRNIVSGSHNGMTQIWDSQTGAVVDQLLTEAPTDEVLPEHTNCISSVAYSPDGRNIISGSDDGAIRIWDAQTRAVVDEPLTGHTEGISSVAYSPDGRNIVSGSDDGTIRTWDAQTRRAVGERLTGHTAYITSVTYSPDGWNIVSCSWDNTIRIWDAQTGVAVGEPLTGHTAYVTGVAYSPDGRNIISGSDDGTIRIWDAQSGAPMGEPLTKDSYPVNSVAYSPDGQNIVAGCDYNTIRIWNAQTGAPVGKPLTGHTNYVMSVTYSPDGRNIVSGSYDKTIRIWDAQTGAPVGEPLTGHTHFVLSVAYSPDGRNIVSGSYDQTFRIWDAQTRELVGQPLRGQTGHITSVVYSPDGQNIVTGSYDHPVQIWNAQTGAPVGEPLTGHTGGVSSVTYSPDGRNIVSCSDDLTIRIWDAQTGPRDIHSDLSDPTTLPTNRFTVGSFSGRPIPKTLLDSNGWVRNGDELLFWVPEDCRHGLTCRAVMTIPNTGRQKCVRIDFTRFQYGTSWTNIRGRNQVTES